MSSESVRQRAEEVVSLLRQALDQERLAALIDQPIDRAAAACLRECDGGQSARTLQGMTAALVRAVYADALPCRREIPDSDARDEAYALLEHGYSGSRTGGYDEALLDAADSTQPGVELVVAWMADALKERRRASYTRWVIARHVDPADWNMKCALASILAEQCKKYLPPELQSCPKEQLSDCAVDLLLLDLATGHQLQQARAGA
ncbi:MAG: hypothetical protein ISS72_09070 [Candidatus Brocadiae bacterium]|nr:hypothetical protein [Candidatus Brocadiia bacterium]